MTPSAILDTLKARGVTLTREGGDLIAAPKAALTDELRALIRQHKAELLKAVEAPLTPELELGIRRMAEAWNYPPEDLQWALSSARLDPAGWSVLVLFDSDQANYHVH